MNTSHFIALGIGIAIGYMIASSSESYLADYDKQPMCRCTQFP